MEITVANEGLALIIMFVGSLCTVAGYFIGVERNCDRDSARAYQEGHADGVRAGFLAATGQEDATTRFEASKTGGVYEHKGNADRSNLAVVILDDEAIYQRGFEDGQEHERSKQS